VTLDRGASGRCFEITSASQFNPNLISVANGKGPRFTDGLPSRAPTQMGGQRAIHRSNIVGRRALGTQTFKATDDPGRAETALTGPGGEECFGPTNAFGLGQTVKRGDGTTGDPTGGGHASHAGRSVDKHCATSALALGIATRFR
jgi:hypothetical protein